MTEPRLLIIKLLVTEEHLTLQDIVSKLKKVIGNVNVMSVYNTLDLLLEHHIIFANTFNGKSILYEVGMENSIHLKCDECQSVIHLNTRDTSLNSGFADIEKIANNNQMTLEHFKIEAHEFNNQQVEQIVCGAKNARVNLVVIAATIGTMMPNGQLIIPGKLKGVESNGMLCSAKELNLINSNFNQEVQNKSALNMLDRADSYLTLPNDGYASYIGGFKNFVTKAALEYIDDETVPVPSEYKDTKTEFPINGVSMYLIKELRKALDDAGHHHVKIIASSGFTPDKIKLFEENNIPVDIYGVGNYLAKLILALLEMLF
ncbi:hypothetical protein FQA39_LY12946 [Lamprigera yunnana]|nr:hypothetical protein FQA39_LY12946 [Lamprigera yunnana]